MPHCTSAEPSARIVTAHSNVVHQTASLLTTLPFQQDAVSSSRLTGFSMAMDRLWGAPEDASAVYALGRDSSKHSTLKVTETLVAEFPDVDQNHGIVRDIPSSYDGHSVHLKVLSVTDGAGTLRAYYALAEAQGMPKPNVIEK